MDRLLRDWGMTSAGSGARLGESEEGACLRPDGQLALSTLALSSRGSHDQLRLPGEVVTHVSSALPIPAIEFAKCATSHP